VTGTTIYLDAIQSEDPDNSPQPLSYLWSFDSVPDESLLTDDDITDRDKVTANFIPDVEGIYVLRLTVSDGDLTSEDTIQIIATATKVPPNADAGYDMTISLGETAFLDGSASNDPDNGPEPLTYKWRFVSLPIGSALTNEDISDADTVTPSFTPDVDGTYLIELIVSDNLDFDSDNVAVTVDKPFVPPGDDDGGGGGGGGGGGCFIATAAR
ncbi:MAG: REJ domain-containing protein, partial [Nitrospinota bacterium]